MKRYLIGLAIAGILGTTGWLAYLQFDRQLADASVDDADTDLTLLEEQQNDLLTAPAKSADPIGLPTTSSRQAIARGQNPRQLNSMASGTPREFEKPRQMGHLRSAQDASIAEVDRFKRQPAEENYAAPASAIENITSGINAASANRVVSGANPSVVEVQVDTTTAAAENATEGTRQAPLNAGNIPPATAGSIPPAEPRGLNPIAAARMSAISPASNSTTLASNIPGAGVANPNPGAPTSAAQPAIAPATMPIASPIMSQNAAPITNQNRPPANLQANSSLLANPARSSTSITSTIGESTIGSGQPGVKRLEGPQQPQLALQKFAPDEIQVGKECVFEVKVKNQGQVPASQVQIIDEIPQGTRLVDTKPQAVLRSDGRVVWDLGTLGPGEQTSVEMRLMPIEEGEIGSVASVQFAAQASARTKSTRPELSVRVTSPPHVLIGEDVVLKIEISNPGTGAATGVILTENVPQGMSHSAGQSLEFEVGTLAPGESRELELALTAEQAGKTVNTIVARGDASLQIEEHTQIEIVSPKLQLSIKGPRKRFLDRQATYEVQIDNPGTAAAQDVEVVTRLPEGMKFVRANNAGQYDSTTHSVLWSLEELPPGQHGKVELVTLPVTSGEQTIRVETTADRGLKDTYQQAVLVEGVAAIMFEVVDVNDPIVVGEETTYEIRVVNQGSKEANNVQIVAEFPIGLQPTSASGPSGHAIDGDKVVFEPLRTLAPKADTAFRIKAKGLRSGDQRIKVRLFREDSTTPVTKEESTQVYDDE